MTPVGKNNEPLDAILRRAMRAAPGESTPECAGAESLAAYSDRSLPASERERLEVHFADCMRCQMLLADIARADAGARGTEVASGVPWYRRWRVAVPALAAVAAIVVFIAIRRPANDDLQGDQLVAMTKPEAPALKAPSPALASQPLAALASNMIAMNEAKQAAMPRAQAMGAAIPAAGAFSASRAGAAGGGGGAVDADASAAVKVSSPDHSATWFIARNGIIWRRDADGSARMQHSGVSADLVAGAAPSAAVCWVVGNSAAIVRTTDGEHWMRITAPSTDNLTAVTASSANDATITTAGGQSFTTSDGGATWHRQ